MKNKPTVRMTMVENQKTFPKEVDSYLILKERWGVQR